MHLGLCLSLNTLAAAIGGTASFTPSDVPDMQLWLQSSDVPEADTVAVASWADGSGNERHAAQATGSKQPVVSVVSGVKWLSFDGSNDYLLTAGIPVQTDGTSGVDWTIIQLVKAGSISGEFMVCSNDDGDTSFAFGHQNTALYGPFWGVVGNLSSGITLDTATPVARILSRGELGVLSGASRRHQCFLNDAEVSYSTVPSLEPGAPTGTGAVIGAGSTTQRFFPGLIGAVMLFDRQLTWAEIHDVLDYLEGTHGLTLLTRKSIVVCDGESTTLGPYVSAGDTYPDRLQTALGSSDWIVKNSGVGGVRWDEIDAEAPFSCDYYRSNQSASYLLVFAVANDAHQDKTFAQIQSEFQSYIANRLAAGWQKSHIILATAPPYGNYTAPQTAVKDAFNTWLKANATTYGAECVDLEAITLLDPNDSTYYQGDKAHLTAAGNQLIADAMFAALSRAVTADSAFPSGSFRYGDAYFTTPDGTQYFSN